MRWPFKKRDAAAIPTQPRPESRPFEGARRREAEGEETERGSELREREGEEPLPVHSDSLP